MAVGRFYLKQGYISAAINRFQTVTEKYQTSNQIPEALYRLTVSFNMMNLDYEAERALKVAQYNFPDSPWTEKAEALMGVTSSSDETDQKGVVGGIISRINIFK